MATSSTPAVRGLLEQNGRTVLVTGAGSGIGRGIALRFAEAGAAVVAHYRRSAEGAEGVARRIRGAGGTALALAADLTVGAEVAALFEQAASAVGGVDVLVNNAGVYPLDPLLETSEAAWQAVLDANLKSAVLCTQAAARQMIARGRPGAIVNVTSIEADNPAPLHSHYSAAKAALAMFTRSAAAELGRAGIRVNAVAPGLIARAGIEDAWPEGVARYRRAAALGRLGEPEDVADACLFLACAGARWITGATLVVDGGVMTHQIF